MKKAKTIQDLLRVFHQEPLNNETSNFFIETAKGRGENARESVKQYFFANIRENKRILFMGHGGSGKSTELWKVSQELKDTFEVIMFSVTKEADPSDLEYVDLFFIILNKIIEKAIELNLNINPNLADNLYHYWHDEKFIEKVSFNKKELEVGAEAKISFLKYFSAHINGLFSYGTESKKVVRDFVKPKEKQLIEGINNLILNVNEELLRKYGKRLLIIVDDLEKLNISIAEKIFLTDRKSVISLRAHIIYSFPIFLHYSAYFTEIENDFDIYVLLAMIKVRQKNGDFYTPGIETIKQIVGERCDHQLFDDGVLDFMIDKSGGVLRDVFEMIEDSALRALSNNDKVLMISMDDVKVSYNKLKSRYIRSINKNQIPLLQELYNDPLKSPISDSGNEFKQLLRSLAVIEYNAERWCNLHPAIEDFLREKKILTNTFEV